MTAELRYGRGTHVGHNQVSLIMGRLGIHGVPKRRLPRGARVGKPARWIFVRRRFRADALDRLWMTDITEHPTRGQDLLLRSPRRFLADSRLVDQTALLVTNALGMALSRRSPGSQSIIHSDQWVQGGSWAFSQRSGTPGWHLHGICRPH